MSHVRTLSLKDAGRLSLVDTSGSYATNNAHSLIDKPVGIVRCGPSTAPCYEGRAVVRDIALGHDLYWVQFDGDKTLKKRVVFREFQHEPERFVAMMRAIWFADSNAFPDVTDFFPDETL